MIREVLDVVDRSARTRDTPQQSECEHGDDDTGGMHDEGDLEHAPNVDLTQDPDDAAHPRSTIT